MAKTRMLFAGLDLGPAEVTLAQYQKSKLPLAIVTAQRKVVCEIKKEIEKRFSKIPRHRY